MATLVKRLQQLEAKLTDRHGLIPHSAKWFGYWEARIDRFIAGERVDLSGMTLEFIDALIAKGTEPADNDENCYQATSSS